MGWGRGGRLKHAYTNIQYTYANVVLHNHEKRGKRGTDLLKKGLYKEKITY